MASENKYKEQYEILGEFVAKVNSIEFFINILLEKIILQYSNLLDIADAAEYTIDHIEEQSLKIRINLIVVFLTMTHSKEVVVQRAVVQLKDFAKYYNKSIRDIRDFIAHNPMLHVSGDALVVSSRRYKGKLNSLKIQELKSHVEGLTPKILEVSKLTAELSALYPKDVVRELS